MDRIRPRQIFASAIILFALTLERLAYYSLTSTFYLFLNKGPWNSSEGWDSLGALDAVYILLGISYISALFGGYISDAWMGRFYTIITGMILYIAGYILLILMTVDKLPHTICPADKNLTLSESFSLSYTPDVPHAPCKPTVYVAIFIVGLGVGMVKANIGPFGAEQLGPSNPSLVRSFFNWYYWCVNVGSIVGIGALAYVEQDNPGYCTNGFFCGYTIAAGFLSLAFLLLLSFSTLFDKQPSTGNSPLLNIARITWEATRLKIRDLRVQNQYSSFNPPPLVRPKFLDLAKVRYGGRFHESAVDDVRAVGSMLVLFASLLPYWLVYFQMQTSFQAQGLHMRFMVDVNRTITQHFPIDENERSLAAMPHSAITTENDIFSIPAAWLTLFNQAFLIIALPILNKFVYPYLDRNGIRLSMLTRIGIGMFISSLAVFTAGGLETFRTILWKTDNSSHITEQIGNVTYNAVDISIFWQVPQYVMVAGAEALASIAGLEYAYSQAPRSFQSLIMGLFYAMEGVGSFLGIALLQILAPFWLNNRTDYGNINDNHLDYYLYFLGIIQLIMLVVYGVSIYVTRFSLELVPMHSDDGIGGPRDPIEQRRLLRLRQQQMRHPSTFRNGAARDAGAPFRELQDAEDDDLLDREGVAVSGIRDAHAEEDDEMLHEGAHVEPDLLPAEDSDESFGVHETPSVMLPACYAANNGESASPGK